MSAPHGEMSFLDHLEELRWRLIKSILAVTAGAIPCGIYWKKIFDLVMVYPLHLARPRPRIIFTTPGETIVLSIKIAIAGGIIAAIPVIMYQFWRFVSPGLYKNERAIILPSVISSSLCFIIGVGFSYVMLPYMLRFLTGYAGGAIEPFFKANDYMTFIIQIVLAFGAVFELPVISFVLTKAGILSPKFLIDKARYGIVAIFVVAAVLTPPDVLSQVILAAPLLVLYAISILVSHLAQPKAALKLTAAGKEKI
jgi:sec-independent protein translocase protein TatC